MYVLRGAGEVPGLGDGHEIHELLELHTLTVARPIVDAYGYQPLHVLD